MRMSTTNACMFKDLADDYDVPTQGAPDFISREWTELSGLRLGMHLGSDSHRSSTQTDYWMGWALF
jgi:hypothetical protein